MGRPHVADDTTAEDAAYVEAIRVAVELGSGAALRALNLTGAKLDGIRAGADPTPVPEATAPTPGQVWHMLLGMPAEWRLDWFRRRMGEAERAARCFAHDHDAMADRFGRLHDEVTAIQEIARKAWHEARRWEEPLQVPTWVREVMEALGRPVECLCGQCRTADAREARQRKRAAEERAAVSAAILGAAAVDRGAAIARAAYEMHAGTYTVADMEADGDDS
jgi:hypothetical protein